MGDDRWLVVDLPAPPGVVLGRPGRETRAERGLLLHGRRDFDANG